MVRNKSLDEYKIIAALLHDIHNRHGLVFNTRALRLTLNKVKSRMRMEGLSFLTKTLPKLGKALDKGLTEQYLLNGTDLRFTTQEGSKLPRFLGELFNRVFDQAGHVLPEPCITSIKMLRDVLYLFYKYELPYTDEQEQAVVSKFEKTEDDISANSVNLTALAEEAFAGEDFRYRHRSGRHLNQVEGQGTVTRAAQNLLSRLFAQFDPRDITPRHGPGAVATKQKLWSKFKWVNISSNITSMYPADEYFYSSAGHICDRLQEFNSVDNKDLPAQVILVPKDSRAPRLISCEPVDYQWIQQGLGRAITELVESHPITRWNVNFTNQLPNRFGAILGSQAGKYATLDLNEASDRVSVGLVRLLFPPHICEYLEACRSSSTVLPDGRVIRLNKFAPMGSALCFPILALTVWAILTAAAPDADTREGILVYGDDVIVPTAFAANAIEQLELYGLKVNRDKSCTSGLFRESCGMDAYKGICVTPVRIRTVWSESPSPEVYTSWIAYANSFYDRQYFLTYQLIVDALLSHYGPIPDDDMSKQTYPSLRFVPDSQQLHKRRWNPNLQKFEFRVRTVKSPDIHKVIDGWEMLLRHFTESSSFNPVLPSGYRRRPPSPLWDPDAFQCGTYTKRDTSMLVFRWR
jgi:hypothetical protein